MIGAHRATTRIPHGAQVEVDPEHGTVRLLVSPMRYDEGPTAHAEVLIDAPLDRVWELVTDINLPAQFSNEFRGATWIDEGPAMGARFVGRNWHKAMGEWETVSIVNRFEPMRSSAGASPTSMSRRRRGGSNSSSSLRVCASVNERAWVRRHQD